MCRQTLWINTVGFCLSLCNLGHLYFSSYVIEKPIANYHSSLQQFTVRLIFRKKGYKYCYAKWTILGKKNKKRSKSNMQNSSIIILFYILQFSIPFLPSTVINQQEALRGGACAVIDTCTGKQEVNTADRGLPGKCSE